MAKRQKWTFPERMPKEARAAMNRIGMQDPKELEQRKRRFRKMAAKYKAEDSRANIKRTAKDVGKELAMEAATFAVGGLAGKALSKGGQAAYKAYKVSKAGKATKGAQKALKAGPKRKLLMAPRAKAAEKLKRSGPPEFGKRVAKPRKTEAKPYMASIVKEAKAMKQRQIDALFSRIGPRTFEYSGKRNQALREAVAKLGRAPKAVARLGRAPKGYKLNTSGKPPAPKPKAKRKLSVKQAKRKSVAKPSPKPKPTERKSVTFNKKRKGYSERSKNKRALNTPRNQLRKAEEKLIRAKKARRSSQKNMNEMQRQGTIELQRKVPGITRRGRERSNTYIPENFIRTKKFEIKNQDKYMIPQANMAISKARRRVKASAIKPRRRK